MSTRQQTNQPTNHPQALEAIKVLSGVGDVLARKMLIYDALAGGSASSVAATRWHVGCDASSCLLLGPAGKALWGNLGVQMHGGPGPCLWRRAQGSMLALQATS